MSKKLQNCFLSETCILVMNMEEEIQRYKEGMERLVLWAMQQGLSTGHADDLNMLLDELLPQLDEIRKHGNKR